MAKIDSEDELKRHMRRRLVGAVALVTAMVVILPMLFETTPKPNDRSIELRIPDKDKAGAFTSQMVVPESAPEVASAAAPGQSASMPVAVASQAASAPSAPAQQAHKPAVAKAEAPRKPEAEHKPEATHKPGPTRAEHAQSAPAKAGFAVQVGAFANAATAKELQDKLHKQGWHAYTEKAGGAIRVRVGPYPTREGAEKALHKLEAQGMHPAVVNEP